MDKILENFLEDFCDEYELSHLKKDKQFEHFVNYCVISNIETSREIVEQINVGGDSNPGIDGLAIVVNDHVVTTEEEVDYFHDGLKRLDVEFFFVQSKTSAKFEMAQVNNFLFSVKSFFSDASLKFEDEVLNLRDLKDYIFDQSIKMEQSPVLKLSFATTGTWIGDQNLTSLVDTSKKELMQTGLFREVLFQPIDINKLKSLYRESKHKITREINFEKHTILPKIDGVTESYIGFIPASEIVNLVSNSEGEIIKSIFYDNVRDFQGYNQVNIGIKESIEDPNLNDKFVLLNNGITIVAKNANKVGTAFKISDFQIVNGCQTSHVLYYLRDNLKKSTNLPVKLIITDNSEVINRVVKATNQQTEVKREAFETLSPFHKSLEEYYLSHERENNKKLYYERRSKQFQDLKINKTSIISLATQISSFVGMFLNEPHSTRRYFGELLRAYRSRLFKEDHHPISYYTSGLGLSIIENLFKQGDLNPSSRKFKHHLMMLFRLQIAGENLPPFNNRKAIEKYCNKILESLWDREKSREIFQALEKTLDQRILNTKLPKRQLHMLRAFTEELQPSIKFKKAEGTLTYFNDKSGYGFVRIMNTQDDVFVHISQMIKDIGEKVEVNDRIKFHVADTYKGRQAKNLELVR